MPRRGFSLFSATGSGGKSRVFSFRKKNVAEPVSSRNGNVKVPFKIGRGPGQSVVNDKTECGSISSHSGRGSSSEAGSARGSVNVGSGSFRSPATIAQEQGPSSKSRGRPGAGRKGSLMLQPNPGAPLIELDADDYSSDDEPQRGAPPSVSPKPKKPVASTEITTAGSETARPLVGGFAAAAYEAAKAHHFATMQMKKQQSRGPVNAGSEPSRSPVSLEQGQYRSAGPVEQEQEPRSIISGRPGAGRKGSLMIQPNPGSSSEAGSSRGPMNGGTPPSYGTSSFGSDPFGSPATTAQEQGSSSNARCRPGAGRKGSLMLQPNPGAPLIDFDDDDYSSDDEPQRGPPTPVSTGIKTTGNASARSMAGGCRPGAGRKGSLMLQPNPGAPLIDFDDDDYSSDDEPQRGPPQPIGVSPGKKKPDAATEMTTTGSATARPMVGGFAAAAYEAAKAHHFATIGKDKQSNTTPLRSY